MTVLRAGDVVLVDFELARGHEQQGVRPGLVVSGETYNRASSFIVVCPITRSKRSWPWKVAIPSGLPVDGFVLVDQVKSIDRASRVVRPAQARLPGATVAEIRGRLAALLGIAFPD